MDQFAIQLNDIIVEAFRSILKVEEQMLKSSRIDLSISEMHLIEAVGKGGDPKGRTISSLAEDLDITLPSVTVGINKLVKKGHATKVKYESDGREVYVLLTRSGKKVDSVHRYFHENMVRKVSGGLNDEEKLAMLSGIMKLNEFFRQRLEALRS